MSAAVQPPMTAEQFLAWTDAPERAGGRWELIDGHVVAVAPEQIRHADLKGRIYRRLGEAIEAAGVPCQALVDGAAVRVSARNLFIPDVLVRCGAVDAPEQREVSNPVVVVEVSLPSTQHLDHDAKLHGYFAVASVRHYLIVHPETHHIVHHRRTDDGSIATSLGGERPIRLDPPGIVLPGVFPTA